jgi:CRP-like cAMP-binding protein
MHDHLSRLISQYVKLTDADIALCAEVCEPVLYPRNRIIEEAGKKPKYLYFVISGYMRLFQYDENGNENTSHINCPPGFITSYSSYIQQTPSDQNVECITDCELLRISRPDLDRLHRESGAMKDFSIAVFEQSLAYNERRSMDLATLTAEQRYQKLLREHPDMLHHVPLQYIASFLGMKPESLSRIRRQIIS